jgi:hypothetical protein
MKPQRKDLLHRYPPDTRIHFLTAREPIGLGQFEFCKVKARRHGASDQRPVAGGFGSLPGVRRDDGLRHFARGEIGAEPDGALVPVIGNLQAQRVARVVMPGLDRIDAVPMRALAARQQEKDRVDNARPSASSRRSRNVSR